jgi:hypothetical protein
LKLFTPSYLTSAVWTPDSHFGLGRFGLGRFGLGRFRPGRFGIHVMYSNYYDDLLKNRKWFNDHMDVPA